MKTAAISQSNYIPWKGYFDLINSADVFVIYDIVQFTKNDWRNRNQLIVNGRPQWLTIPVKHNTLKQTIDETQIASPIWAKKHWLTIKQNYCKTPGFKLYADELSSLYSSLSSERNLSAVNEAFIRRCCELLGIKTEIVRASDFSLPMDRINRISSLCKQLDCNTYLSGPAAQSYLQPENFKGANIELQWMDYQDYPEYKQQSFTFTHNVSIFDLLFNTETFKTPDYENH